MCDSRDKSNREEGTKESRLNEQITEKGKWIKSKCKRNNKNWFRNNLTNKKKERKTKKINRNERSKVKQKDERTN